MVVAVLKALTMAGGAMRASTAAAAPSGALGELVKGGLATTKGSDSLLEQSKKTTAAITKGFLLANLTLAGIQKTQNAIVKASPQLAATLKILGYSIMFVLRPIGDLISMFLRPIALLLMKVGISIMRWMHKWMYNPKNKDEAKVAGGAITGMAAGGAIGFAVGGPIGAIIGGLIIGPLVGVIIALREEILDVFWNAKEQVLFILRSNYRGVVRAFTDIKDFIKEVLKNIWDRISKWATDWKDLFKKLWTDIGQGITNVKDFIINKWNTLWNAVTSGFTTAVNFVIRQLNKLPGVDISPIDGPATGSRNLGGSAGYIPATNDSTSTNMVVLSDEARQLLDLINVGNQFGNNNVTIVRGS